MALSPFKHSSCSGQTARVSKAGDRSTFVMQFWRKCRRSAINHGQEIANGLQSSRTIYSALSQNGRSTEVPLKFVSSVTLKCSAFESRVPFTVSSFTSAIQRYVYLHSLLYVDRPWNPGFWFGKASLHLNARPHIEI